METTNIKLKDLKGFGNIQIPFLLLDGNNEPKVVAYNLLDLSEDTVISIISEDQDKKFQQLLNKLIVAKLENEPDDQLLLDIEASYKQLLPDSQFINYFSAFEDNYPNKKEKKAKEHKAAEIIEVTKTDLPIPEDTSQVKLEQLNKTSILSKESKVVENVSPFDITPKQATTPSLKNSIINSAYLGLEKPVDKNCASDILGRWWDLDELAKFDFGDMLIDNLVKEQYPPYLSNPDKDELEYINNKFIEIKGRKPFE